MVSFMAIIRERAPAARRVASTMFGGRYSREAWVGSTVVYGAAAWLVTLPYSTFLWTSPRPLRDIYLAFAIIIGTVALCGIGLVYAKRLQDQGRPGFWAAIPLVGLPWALIAGAQAWGNQVWREDSSASASDYMAIAGWVALLVAVIVGLLPARDGGRFGPRYTAKEVLHFRRLPVALTIIVAFVVAAVSIYGGLVQPGIWVGRSQFEYSSGTPSGLGGGLSVATCAGAKGVNATVQEGREQGFSRDAVNGSWNVVLLPDGTWDIQTVGNTGVISYVSDGFKVDVNGLRFGEYGSVAADVDSFHVIATSSNQAGDVSAVTTLAFAKMAGGYRAVIAASRVFGAGSIYGLTAEGHPRASTFLMIADCTVDQDYTP